MNRIAHITHSVLLSTPPIITAAIFAVVQGEVMAVPAPVSFKMEYSVPDLIGYRRANDRFKCTGSITFSSFKQQKVV